MALHLTPAGQAPAIRDDVLRILLIVGVVLLLMIAATAVFGWNAADVPSFDLTPDPIWPLDF